MAAKCTILETAKVPGDERRVEVEITLDSEYAAEGEPVTATEFGLTRIISGFCLPLQGSESEGVEFGFAKFERKTDTKAVIRAYNYKTQKEIATGKDLQKVKVLAIVRGR